MRTPRVRALIKAPHDLAITTRTDSAQSFALPRGGSRSPLASLGTRRKSTPHYELPTEGKGSSTSARNTEGTRATQQDAPIQRQQRIVAAARGAIERGRARGSTRQCADATYASDVHNAAVRNERGMP